MFVMAGNMSRIRRFESISSIWTWIWIQISRVSKTPFWIWTASTPHWLELRTWKLFKEWRSATLLLTDFEVLLKNFEFWPKYHFSRFWLKFEFEFKLVCQNLTLPLWISKSGEHEKCLVWWDSQLSFRKFFKFQYEIWNFQFGPNLIKFEIWPWFHVSNQD